MSKLIDTTLPLNLRLKYLTKKSLFWMHAYVRAKDLREKIFLTCALILNDREIPIYAFQLLPPLCLPKDWKGFIKGEALRLLRTNSSAKTFDENIKNSKPRLSKRSRGSIQSKTEGILPEAKFVNRVLALKQKQSTQKKLLPSNCHTTTQQCLT